MGRVVEERVLQSFYLRFSEKFCDLDGIESGPFADLIADDPEGEGIWDDLVPTNATDEAVVLSDGIKWDGVEALRGIIAESDSDGLGVDRSGFGDGGIFFEDGGDGDGVGAHHGDADAGAGDSEFGEVENFATFVEHFLLLLGVAAVLESIDVWDDVVNDLVGVDFFLNGIAGDEGAGLGFEFGDALGSASGDRLISGGNDAL